MATVTDTEPLFISVTEAARLLGISRSHAYDQAHLGLATNGVQGLPAIRLGRRLLVRRGSLTALNPTSGGRSASVGP